MNTIKFYGSTHCHDCLRSRELLDMRKISYEYINIDEVPGAADEVVQMNNGMRSTPTIFLPNGKVLIEPSDEDLSRELDAL